MITVKAETERVLPNGSRVMVQDRFRNPIAIKATMQVLGMPAGPCRKPLGKLSTAGADVIRKVLRKVLKHTPELLEPVGRFYNSDIEARLRDDAIWQSLVYRD
jgi:4-hydroxy-tetrahydrodipicolinate synthase